MDSALDQKQRHMVYGKIEALISEMKRKDTGLEVKKQKSHSTTVPDVFTGGDCIAWLRENLTTDTEEAQHLATLLCHFGYIFPVMDLKTQSVKEDSSPFRFQDPYYWPSKASGTDNIAYAIFLKQRSLRNKQKHGLEDYEQAALDNLEKILYDKVELIKRKAEAQVVSAKKMETSERAVRDSQERAFWRIHRPAPGQVKRREEGLKHYWKPSQVQERLHRKDILSKRVYALRCSLSRHKVKPSYAVDMCICQADPFLSTVYPSNPWVSDCITFWEISTEQSDTITEQRVRKWAVSLRDLLVDKRGQAEFNVFLEKEYSQENLHFWLDCEWLKFSPVKSLQDNIDRIFSTYLSENSAHEVNIDSKRRAQVQRNMEEGQRGKPSRFTFSEAQDQIFCLMKKDSYVRFLQSEHYKQLLNNSLNQDERKGFFSLGAFKKSPPSPSPMQHQRTSSQCYEGSWEAAIKGSNIHHSRSTSDLRDADDGTVLLRYESNPSEASLRKCNTAQGLCQGQERGSFTKGSHLRQQPTSSGSPKHMSLNLGESSASSVTLLVSKTTT